MLKIGEFSKLSRVSVRMLRHYDEIGLLRPQLTDRFTDYRYYSESQLPLVCRITALKDMGFRLVDICRILEIYDDPQQLAAYLHRRRQELEQEAADTARKLQLLENAVQRLRKDDTMAYQVTIRTLPQRYAACVRMTIPNHEAEGMVWQTLCEETDAMHLIPDDPCYCSVTFLDGEYKEHNVEVEAQKTVKGSYPDTEHVRFRTLPPVTYAGCTYQGGYEQIGEVNAVLAAWIEANGYTYDGPMFNIYHVSPHETQDPAEFITEVCYPVKRKA